jgi:Phage integrase family
VVAPAAAPVSVSAPGRANNLRRVYKAAVDAAGADLGHLDLRGPHDLRHTFSTWLEDAGIPARVIDELMGHQASGRVGRHPGQCHRGPLPAHHPGDGRPSGGCGRGAPGRRPGNGGSRPRLAAL